MPTLYDADFFQWTQDTSDRLRRGELAKIDIPAFAEEVEDLGKQEKSAENAFPQSCPYTVDEILTTKDLAGRD